MKSIKSLFKSYALPVLCIAILGGVFYKWGGWVTLSTVGVIIALMGGMFMIDMSAKANIIYWTIISSIGGCGYALKTHAGNGLAIVFAIIVTLFFIIFILTIMSVLMKGKYK